jgi:signal-transduction protein with cAMP-binding, CBS, and nucleotidyltransferase domain
VTDLSNLLVSPTASLRDVMACIDRNRKGVALVVDDERRLTAIVTDGDLRRAILAGTDLDQPVRWVSTARSPTIRRRSSCRPGRHPPKSST